MTSETKDLTHLCLSLREGEFVKIGESYIKIREVGHKRPNQVMIQINAPRDVEILREGLIRKDAR